LTATQLTVLAIVDNPATVSLFARVFSNPNDRMLISTDLAEGLALAAAEAPDLAFVDVTLGHNAGLALVHHLRAVAPSAMIYALARPEALEVGAQAAALGGAGLIMMPCSGDELLTAASEARTRLATTAQAASLQEEARLARRAADFANRIAALAESPDRNDAAKKLAWIFAEATQAKVALVYVPASEGSAELLQAGMAGHVPGAPTFTDEMGLMGFARQSNCELVALAIRQIAEGHVLLAGLPTSPWSGAERNAAEMMAGQAATTLALLGERERSTRGAIKDRTTSAYTFAYFVDIAGREIDKARRYGRRFALATIGLDEESVEASNELAESVLSAVRDTDVLARVDEREFYLLMPETGGVARRAAGGACCSPPAGRATRQPATGDASASAWQPIRTTAPTCRSSSEPPNEGATCPPTRSPRRRRSTGCRSPI
jgi:DNA-binding response OmpR family regulator/GGDEF domain-containing protein